MSAGARRAGWCGAGLGVLMMALGPLPATAQAGLSLTGGFSRYAGPDFNGTPGGPTLGGAVHLEVEDHPAEISLGVDYSRYGEHGFVGPTRQLDYSAVLRTPVGGRPGLLAGIRFGFSTRSLSVVDEPARTEGVLVGPNLALRLPTRLGPVVETSLDALYHSYEELVMYGGREYGTDQDGFRILLRIGVWVPLGDG